jgi:organic hydroperoxide reductase OsmC/OhrA
LLLIVLSAWPDAPAARAGETGERPPDQEGATMARAKQFEFPVGVEWEGGSLTVASVAGKQDLDVATPPELGGDTEGVWSPEDLLVASAASCFAVTLAAIVRHRAIPLLSLHVEGNGRVGPRDDGRLGFTSIDLSVAVETDSSDAVPGLEAAIERAEKGCLVALALSIPVHVHATVAVAEATPAATMRART